MRERYILILLLQKEGDSGSRRPEMSSVDVDEIDETVSSQI